MNSHQMIMKRIALFSFLLFFAKASFSARKSQYTADDLNCSIYRNGYFRYAGDYEQFVILREGDYQIEYNFKTKQWVTVKLSWPDGCDYSFVYVATNIKRLESRIGYRLSVDILSGNANGYFYKALDEQSGKDVEGHIVFLKEKLSSTQNKKIRTKLAKTSVKR